MLKDLVDTTGLLYRAYLAEAVGVSNGRFNPDYGPNSTVIRGSTRWDEDSRAKYHNVNRSAVRGERGQSGSNWGHIKLQRETRNGR